LFEPLGRETYRNFLITGENLQTLIDEEAVEDYMDFFRNNYINRSQTQQTTPSSEQPTEPAEAQETESEYSETATEESQESKSYTGPFDENIEKPHLFVFVVPNTGIDQTTFVAGISQYNEASDSGELAIEVQEVDEFREAIVISGFPDKESATRYFRTVVQNRDLFAPLGEATYRNFLITEQNFDVFLQEKNITDYMNFYKQIYLGE
jgi:hypothetical protein